MRRFFLSISIFFLPVLAYATDRGNYPAEWFAEVPRDQLASWEIAPQDAKPGEVILSKRTPLGILSNFASTPFELDNKSYESIEGFWQMMKYPECPNDPRETGSNKPWPYTREQVSKMVGFEAKNAGSFGSEVMKKLGINWVSYECKNMTYRTPEKGEHYDLILRAMRSKLDSNPSVRSILLQTGDLILMPDHQQEADASPAWKYNDIWMDIRAELKKQKK